MLMKVECRRGAQPKLKERWLLGDQTGTRSHSPPHFRPLYITSKLGPLRPHSMHTLTSRHITASTSADDVLR